MKRILIIIIIIFTTSCAKYTDLRDLSIIKSIGISYQDEYIIYAQIYEKITKDNDPIMKLVESKDKDLIKAFNNIKKTSNNEIFFSHIDLLILDTNLQNVNYSDIINYFINNNFRNDYTCILSSNIKELLNNSKYNEIENLLKVNNDVKKIINVTFDEMANNFLEKKEFSLSNLTYKNGVILYDSYHYKNNKLERIDYE